MLFCFLDDGVRQVCGMERFCGPALPSCRKAVLTAGLANGWTACLMSDLFCGSMASTSRSKSMSVAAGALGGWILAAAAAARLVRRRRCLSSCLRCASTVDAVSFFRDCRRCLAVVLAGLSGIAAVDGDGAVGLSIKQRSLSEAAICQNGRGHSMACNLPASA